MNATATPIHAPPRSAPRVWVCAAGTGGHIFPGLSVAQTLKARGIDVQWLGTPEGMEHRLVGEQFPMLTLNFAGLRGKGWRSWLTLPWRLIRALLQARALLRQHAPRLILAMGGYIIVPVILANKLFGRAKVVIHEQNRLAGTANQSMAHFADAVLCGFAGSLPRGEAVGNPVNARFFQQDPPKLRYQARANRQAPLQLLIMGGSLGAQAINRLIPKALALWANTRSPDAPTLEVLHQCGRGQEVATEAQYASHDFGTALRYQVVPFIADVAGAMANADWMIARAGAQTVSEVAAVGVATLFVPFPFAIDDHQTHNARYLVEVGGATLIPQSELSAEDLARQFAALTRETLIPMAEKAQSMAMRDAAEKVATTITTLIGAENRT